MSEDIFPQQQIVYIERKSNGIGTAGFIFAILALLVSWAPRVGWIIWFLGFLFSFIGVFKSPRGLAITGFLISIIDFIVLVVVIGSLATMLGLF